MAGSAGAASRRGLRRGRRFPARPRSSAPPRPRLPARPPPSQAPREAAGPCTRRGSGRSRPRRKPAGQDRQAPRRPRRDDRKPARARPPRPASRSSRGGRERTGTGTTGTGSGRGPEPEWSCATRIAPERGRKLNTWVPRSQQAHGVRGPGWQACSCSFAGGFEHGGVVTAQPGRVGGQELNDAAVFASLEGMAGLAAGGVEGSLVSLGL